MEQEHMTITDLGNGFYKLEPEKGYKLKMKDSQDRYFSEAITKSPQDFVAVAVE